MVYVPAGTFLTGALTLQDHMELYLGEGAVLQGSSNHEDYLPRIPSRFEGTERECYQSLLNLGVMDHRAGCTSGNVLIRGKGTISGGGRLLAERMMAAERERLKEYIHSLGDKVLECENAGARQRTPDPDMQCKKCKDYRAYSPKWIRMERTYDIFRTDCYRPLHIPLGRYLERG